MSEPTKETLGLFADVEKDVPACRLVGPSRNVIADSEGWEGWEGWEKDGEADLEGLGFCIWKVKEWGELVGLWGELDKMYSD